MGRCPWMMWIPFIIGVMVTYIAHRFMLQQNGYKYMKNKYRNSLGRINVQVKINKKSGGGQY